MNSIAPRLGKRESVVELVVKVSLEVEVVTSCEFDFLLLRFSLPAFFVVPLGVELSLLELRPILFLSFLFFFLKFLLTLSFLSRLFISPPTGLSSPPALLFLLEPLHGLLPLKIPVSSLLLISRPH